MSFADNEKEEKKRRRTYKRFTWYKMIIYSMVIDYYVRICYNETKNIDNSRRYHEKTRNQEVHNR